MEDGMQALHDDEAMKFKELSASEASVRSVQETCRLWVRASHAEDADVVEALTELEAAIVYLEEIPHFEHGCGKQLFEVFTDPYLTCTLAIGCSLAAVFGRKCMDVEVFVPKLVKLVRSKSIVSQVVLVALSEVLARNTELLESCLRPALVKGASQSLVKTCRILCWGPLAVRVRGMDAYLVAACRLLGQFGDASHETILHSFSKAVQAVRVGEWDVDACLREAHEAIDCIRSRNQRQSPPSPSEAEAGDTTCGNSSLLPDARASAMQEELHEQKQDRSLDPHGSRRTASDGTDFAYAARVRDNKKSMRVSFASAVTVL